MAAGCAVDGGRTEGAAPPDDLPKVLQSAEVTVTTEVLAPTEETVPTGKTVPTETTAAEESVSGGVQVLRTHAILPDGTLEKLEPLVDPADAAWDTPTGIVTALVEPMQIFDPPGMDIEEVTISTSTGDSGTSYVSVAVSANGDFTYNQLQWITDDFPIFPGITELLTNPTFNPTTPRTPRSGTFGSWTKAISGSYHPDHPAVDSGVKATATATGAQAEDVLGPVLAEPVRNFLDRFPDVVVRYSRLTWEPSEPNRISASLRIVGPSEDQLEIARWVGARAIPGTYVHDNGLSATLAGEPEVSMGWSADWQETRVGFSFDYLLDDEGKPAVTAYFPPPVGTNLIDWGQDWHFDDDGSVDAGWNLADFNPIGWKREPAPFHREESPRLFPTLVDTPREGLTSWFRKTFDLADPSSVDRLDLETMVDDGLVVWLNGVELYRWNMPEGRVASATQAVERISGHGELIVHRGIDLPPDALSAGENVVAVEVHQATADSSDIRFDLRLRAS